MGIGPWQIIIIVLIVILLFGAKRLPNLGRSLGEAITGFKKGLAGEDGVDVTDSTQKNEKLASQDNTEATQKAKSEEKEKS